MLDKRLLLFVAPLALAACGDKDSAPTGQVVATVNGEEITTTDLDAELAGATAPNPEAQKNLQRMALENIINRTILAQAAEKEGVLKGPELAVTERKARQMALIEMMQRKLGGSLPKPSAEEVENYINENPYQFANRRIYVVDQIVVPQANQQLLQALQPVKTMAQATEVLNKFNIKGNNTVGVIDSLTVPGPAAQQLGSLPADEVFIIPANGSLRINKIRSSQVDPLSGDQAKAIATELLSRQRAQNSVQTSLGEKVKAGRANVKYNASFEPPKAPAAPKAAPAAQPAPAE